MSLSTIHQQTHQAGSMLRLLTFACLVASGVTALITGAIIPFCNAGTQQSRVYAATGFSVSGAFLDFYDRYGGVRQFGYPISERVTEDGRPVQYFERQRLEYHSEAAGTPNEVMLGRLGAQLAPSGALATSSAPFEQRPNQVYFAETRHSLSGVFLDYWRTNGGLRLLGLPISEPVKENGWTVQWFERARMEYHPEKAANGYGVELGLLGKQYLQTRATQAEQAAQGDRGVSPTSRGAEPAAPAVGAGAPLDTSTPLSDKESELITRINAARQAAGAGTLNLDGVVRGIALSRSKDMAERGYFSHTAPDGTDFLTMIKAARVPFKYSGEILANNNYEGGQSAVEAFNGFMNSPHHHEIMLDPRYNIAGVGEATDGSGFHYFTVIFIQK